MQLPKLDPNGLAWNESVLHALGASTISYPDPNAGPVVDPEINLGGYLMGVAEYVPPITCTKRQLLIELLARGKTEDDVLQAFSDAPEALIEWNYPDNGIFNRQHAMFAELAKDLSLTTSEMNAVFVAASSR